MKSFFSRKLRPETLSKFCKIVANVLKLIRQELSRGSYYALTSNYSSRSDSSQVNKFLCVVNNKLLPYLKHPVHQTLHQQAASSSLFIILTHHITSIFQTVNKHNSFYLHFDLITFVLFFTIS